MVLWGLLEERLEAVSKAGRPGRRGRLGIGHILEIAKNVLVFTIGVW